MSGKRSPRERTGEAAGPSTDLDQRDRDFYDYLIERALEQCIHDSRQAR